MPSQSSKSLGDELRHSEGKEVHVFYIHGIGSDGPKDRDSLALRKSICDYLKDCTTPEGTPIGEWDQTATAEQTRSDLQEILKRTPLVVFFANQLRLLELAALDGPSERNIATDLHDWGKVRCEYLKSLPSAPQECKPPRIIALNDPSDLLTWTVPALGDIRVENYSVTNSTLWLWLFANPTSAHSNYATDKLAIKEMLTSSDEKK